ncbi:MAG: 30S ribosomal protein S17 [bacterium]|nr:30S ribosomal protein S17 [bacterium]
MPKVFTGTVVSDKMNKTAVVEIKFYRLHPKYKKKMKRVTRLKTDTSGFNIKVGDVVKLAETKPISKDKHTKIIKIL